MSAFEEAFKTRAQDTEADQARLMKITEAKQKRGTSIIDVTRARNLCKRHLIALRNVVFPPHVFGLEHDILVFNSHTW